MSSYTKAIWVLRNVNTVPEKWYTGPIWIETLRQKYNAVGFVNNTDTNSRKSHSYLIINHVNRGGKSELICSNWTEKITSCHGLLIQLSRVRIIDRHLRKAGNLTLENNICKTWNPGHCNQWQRTSIQWVDIQRVCKAVWIRTRNVKSILPTVKWVSQKGGADCETFVEESSWSKRRSSPCNLELQVNPFGRWEVSSRTSNG